MATEHPVPEFITQRDSLFARGIVWADIIAEIERDRALREDRGRNFSEIQDAA